MAVLWVVGLALLVLAQPVAGGSFTVAAQSCNTSQYYDSSTFACIDCDSSQEASSDGFSCVCKAGYIRSYASTFTSTSSTPCTLCTSAASSANRLFCQTCDSSTTGLDSSTLECGCASGSGLVEVDTAGSYRTFKSCTTCTAGSYLSGGYCVACPDSRMTATGSATQESDCTCTSAYVQVNNSCLHLETANQYQASYVTSSAYTVSYPDVVSASGSFQTSLTSAVMSKWFYEAGVKCSRGAGVEWCQMLANMCVLNMYLRAHPSCSLFISLATSSLNGFSGWTESIGFLYYSDITAITTDTSILKEFELTDDASAQISITLAQYAFNGTFLGWHALDIQLALCGAKYDALTKWESFGTWRRWSCDIDINRFFRTNDTTFYDPYFIDSDGKYYPMPVQVENYRDATGATPNDNAGNYYNQGSFGSTAVFTRRFMIVDNLSGRITEYNSAPDVVRLLAKAGILMPTRDPDSPGKIYPPRLLVKYHEVDVNGLDANTEFRLSNEFGIAYRLDVSTYESMFTVYLVVCLIFLGILFGARMFWAVRARGSSALDGEFVLAALGVLARSVSHTFGVAFIVFALYVYAVLKMQGTVSLLLPSNEEIASSMYLYWSISFIGVFTGTLSVVIAQTNLDVFFVDWETPPGRTFSSNNSTSQVAVSAWRVLFVANEFARLQVSRVTDFNVTCIWVAFLLAGMPSMTGAYYNAKCNTPDGSLLTDCSQWATADLLRIAVDAFFWIVVTSWQLLFTKFLYHAYYKHPSLQLLDVMSLSNVSAWMLSHKYVGYYLHGQSPLQHADTVLSDFTECLASEEGNMASSRGLVGEQQEFVMFIAPETRDKYEAFLEQIHDAKEQQNESLTFIGQLREEFGSRRGRLHKPGSNALLDGQKAVNGLLKQFVKEMQTTYRDTNIIQPSLIQRFTHLPPPRDEVTHAVFHEDTGHSWTSVLFEGIEFDLILFDIYVFTMFDLLIQNPLAAMLCTFCLQKLIDFARHERGIQNLGEKTLIGSQFFL